MSDISVYPVTSELIAGLAALFKVNADNILLGCGSEQLIKLITQTFLKPDEIVSIEKGSFALFTKESLLALGKVVLRSLGNLTKNKTKIIFVANPKTPTGEVIAQSTIRRLIKTTPGVLVVDEANGEFIDKTAIPEAVQSQNTLVLRTFSKTFGLAGLRIAYVIGPTNLIEKLKEAQQPFPVTQIAVKLSLTALKDQSFVLKTRKFIAKERIFVRKELKKLGMKTTNSVTNNLFVICPKTEEVIGELRKRGVSVINGKFFPGMDRTGFRISLKNRKINQRFLKKLGQTLACIEKRNLLRSKEVV